MTNVKEELGQIHLALAADTRMCLTLMESADQSDATRIQFLRRTFVRAAFAHIEGVIYAMKQFAYEYRIQPEPPSARPESALLLEEAYELTDKGDVRVVSAKIPFLKNIKFAFKTFARAGHSDYELPTNARGWEKLQASIKVRDRLMHPKSVDDTVINESEHSTVLYASSWFMTCAKECIGGVKALVRYEVVFRPPESQQD